MAEASLLPADAEAHVRTILEGQDLTTMSLKEVRSKLEVKLGKEPGSLDPAKGEIKALVSAEITRQQEQEEGDGSASGSDSGGKKQATATKRDREEKKDDDEPSARKKKKKGEGKGATKRQSDAMTRKHFMDNAQPFKVKIGDKEVKVPPKNFSTGSCGFYASQKVTLDVDGQPLTLQCQFSCQVIGSKQWVDE